MSELDRILDQRGMNSLKWEFTVRNGEPEVWKETDPELGEEQVLSMWVADMDFRTAEPVIQALRERVERGICLLYTSPSPRDRSVSRMPSSA